MISMAASSREFSTKAGPSAMRGLRRGEASGSVSPEAAGKQRVAGTHQGSIETRYSWVVAITAVTMLSLAAGGPITVVVGLVQIAEDFGSG